MRDCYRNQVPFWYAQYMGKKPVLKNGFETGQYEETYSEPIQARASITPATGQASEELFGAAVRYDRIISTVQELPGLDEFSRVWIERTPEKDVKHDYKVERVAKGLNQNLWAISKVV